MKKIGFMICCLCIPLLFAGCTGSKSKWETKEGIYFDTAVRITVYGEKTQKVLEECFAICGEMEQIFSRTLEGSELYQVNHRTASTVTVSEELAEVIGTGLSFYEKTGGAFDITIAPVQELWDFKGKTPQVPDPARIQDALEKVDGSSVHLNGRQLTFEREDTQLDLGGLAKGYIADRLKAYLKEQEIKSAMIDLGGNVLAVGEKPDKSAWKVGIQKPFAKRGEAGKVLEIRDQSVVSSGTYERYFEQDGVRYHHILDPFTGYPKNSGYVQVTIVSDSSLLGDALSTSCLLLGPNRAEEILAEYPEVEWYPVME